MLSMSLPSRLWSALAVAFACAQGVVGDHAAASQQAPAPEITREDIFIPHVSTVPANAGQRVGIFVRHVRRAAPGLTKGPVLFTNAGSISTLALLDLDYKTYSIAAALAGDGFDVYLMDHTGYGRSPRPMMDNPCNVDPSQQQLLIPNPLAAPCSPSYSHHLVTIFTELPEIDSVVDYIRKQTGRNRIFLAGWSRATFRFGLYAGQHPDKVERLAIVGPGYRRDAPSDFPALNMRTADQSVRTMVPRWPFHVRNLDDPFTPWERQRRCDDIVDPGIHGALSKSVRKYADPGAATWGTPPGELYRIPVGSQVDAGWNRTSAKQLKVPTLLVVGEHDPRFAEEAPNLYADISSTDKVLVKVQCATHFLLLERNHTVVHNAVAEFLTRGTVNGRQGILTVDRTGKYLP
jgi:pimeloyl-ACP methyl ester carboxylesterase